MDEDTTFLFRIILASVVVLAFVTYPWSKGPWLRYAEFHLFGWLLLLLSFLMGLVVYLQSATHLFLVGSVAFIIGCIGFGIVIVNYLK